MNNPSIFTKIINGEIPSYKVYEDELTFAFLDIYSEVEGHTLVVPKKQVESLWDLDDDDYEAVMKTSKKVALRLREVLGTKYVGEKVVGTDVPHAHVHLVPFDHVGEFVITNEPVDEPDHDALAQVASRIAL